MGTSERVSEKIEAVRRVTESRRRNESIGIVTATVMIPKDDVPELAATAADLRARHMMAIADGNNMDLIRMLAEKRSGWSLANKNQMDKLELLTGDSRVMARQLVSRYSDLNDFVSEFDPEVYSHDDWMRAKAQRVAVGNSLLALLSELEM